MDNELKYLREHANNTLKHADPKDPNDFLNIKICKNVYELITLKPYDTVKFCNICNPLNNKNICHESCNKFMNHLWDICYTCKTKDLPDIII